VNAIADDLDWSPESLLADARAKSGLSDFGDDPFLEPMGVLAESLSREAGLHRQGRQNARGRIVDSLVARLSAQEYFTRYPEILREEVGAPFFIVGLARSGTTRLHRLLAVDSRLYAANWWEVRFPSPFPGSDWEGGADPRIAQAKEQVQQILEHQPALAAIHPYDAEAPDEEIMLLEHSFMSQVAEASAKVPSYVAWLDRQDHVPAYAYLKKMLQFLQWQKKRSGRAAERWVLKGPFHLGYLDALFSVFPDAKIVQTHRDPVETIPSIASMHYALWQMDADDVDAADLGRQSRDRFSWALRRCMELRDAGLEAHCLDVWYQDVNRDPLGEVQRIFDFLGHDPSDGSEGRMREWLADNERGKRAEHRYSAEPLSGQLRRQRAGKGSLQVAHGSWRQLDVAELVIPATRASASGPTE
jgi:hypothetical protein